MKFVLVYALWLVVLDKVECQNKNGTEHINVTAIKMEIQKVEFELHQMSKVPRHFNIFKLNEKLEYLKNLKNLLHQHLATFISNKLNFFHQKPTAEPPTTINIITTTSEETTTEGGGSSTTMPSTTLMPDNTNPIPCYQENDLAIVVDASGSVGSDNYKTALEFGARLLSTWKLYEKNGVAAAVYASSVFPIFTFDNGAQLNENGVKMAILAAPYLPSGTSSHLALDWTLNEHNSHNSTVEKNLVFLTDGFSNYPQLTLEAAERLARQRIRVFSVDVGQAVNQEELLQIAGNMDTHVFTTDTFMDLLDILKPISEMICM